MGSTQLRGHVEPELRRVVEQFVIKLDLPATTRSNQLLLQHRLKERVDGLANIL